MRRSALGLLLLALLPRTALAHGAWGWPGTLFPDSVEHVAGVIVMGVVPLVLLARIVGLGLARRADGGRAGRHARAVAVILAALSAPALLAALALQHAGQLGTSFAPLIAVPAALIAAVAIVYPFAQRRWPELSKRLDGRRAGDLLLLGAGMAAVETLIGFRIGDFHGNAELVAVWTAPWALIVPALLVPDARTSSPAPRRAALFVAGAAAAAFLIVPTPLQRRLTLDVVLRCAEGGPGVRRRVREAARRSLSRGDGDLAAVLAERATTRDGMRAALRWWPYGHEEQRRDVLHAAIATGDPELTEQARAILRNLP